MTNEIKALEARVAELESQLNAAKDLLKKARLEACPVKVGDIVTYRGVDHLVVDVDVRWHDLEQPWLVGSPRKASGEFGIAKRNLYRHWKRK